MIQHLSPASDPRTMREVNNTLILRLLRSGEPLSRAEIARKLHLTRATISNIIEELIATDLILEQGPGESSGGRRPRLLEFNPDAGYILALEVSSKFAFALLTNLGAVVIAEKELNFSQETQRRSKLPEISAFARNFLKQANKPVEKLLGVGIAMPSAAMDDRGRVEEGTLITGTSAPHIQEIISRDLRVTVFLENDGNLGALGEWYFGAGSGSTNMAYVKIGESIGAGLIIDGSIYRGQYGGAGGIGHIIIEENGPPCYCGNFGCLEAVAGEEAIARRAQAAIYAGQKTSLAHLKPYTLISGRDVANAAREGDPLSRQIFHTAGRQTGIAIAGLINLFNPGRVVIGGDVTDMGNILFDAIQKTAKTRSLPTLADRTEIVRASLGHRSAAFGAIALVLQESLDKPQRRKIKRLRDTVQE